MKRYEMALLALTEILLLIKLSINQDLVLALTIIFVQFILILAILNFDSREKKKDQSGTRGTLVLAILVLAAIAPVFLFHNNSFEKSSWVEAGLLMQGPFMMVLLLLGVVASVLAALTSLYLRGRR